MDMPNHALQTSQLLSSSLHFWWIAFLRSSPDYWWICQQNGCCQDERLVRVWQDFGNLYEYTSLAQWWQDKGPALFDSPQVEIALTADMLAGLQLLQNKDLATPKPGMLCLAIPLTMDAGALSAAIARVFQNARIRGQHYNTDAKYQLETMGKKGLPTVVQAYLAQALKVCVAQSQPHDAIHRWGGYQMAQHLDLCPTNSPKPTDTLKRRKDKQRNTRTKHSQVLQAAKLLVANAEIGRFPCRNPVETQPRWSRQQLRDQEDAIHSGAWQPSDWLCNEHTFMLPEHGIAQFDALGQPVHTNLAILADLQGIDRPFLKPVRPRAKH